MNKEDNSVPLNVYPFCPTEKTLSRSEHLNLTVIRLQGKAGIDRLYAKVKHVQYVSCKYNATDITQTANTLSLHNSKLISTDTQLNILYICMNVKNSYIPHFQILGVK
jgi:hypothetical protein